MLLGRFPNFLRQRPGTAMLAKGGPGIGKTEVAIDTILNEGWGLAKMVAAQETPESVAGFLWVDPQNKQCEYFPQRRLRSLDAHFEAGRKAVLVIDEFKGGDRMTHNALQQLIREHEVGDWVAKGHLYVLALTNREEDRANVVRLTAPMINRFVQVEVLPDFEFWSGWAGTRGLKELNKEKTYPKVHPDCLGFLRAVFIGGVDLKSEKAKEWAKDKSLLFCSPAPKDESAFPTPRAYEVASDCIYKYGGDDEYLRESLAGSIGIGPMIEFMAWRKVGKEASNVVDDILNGKSVKTLDIGMQFFVNSQLTAHYARDQKKVADALTKYLSEVESEYAILLINDAASISDAITKSKDWMKVVQKHKKVALAGKRP